jgi:DNA-directed RNA polymerase specialized sigma24 family protein
VLRAEAVRRLTDAVEKLPELLRLVLSLRYIEDLTYREIAGMLWSHLTHCRSRRQARS